MPLMSSVPLSALPEHGYRSFWILLTLVRTWYTVCEPVRSPTLCGSPTVIVKLGLDACSTLMLCLDTRGMIP